MTKKFRPMLAVACEDIEKLNYPVLCSPKLDGIRCIIRDGVAMSRSMKPIPNQHVQCLFGKKEYEGLDGELIVGSPTDPHCYNKSVSGVMSRDGEPDVCFYVFDRVPKEGQEDTLFRERLQEAALVVNHHGVMMRSLLHDEIHTPEELSAFEEECVSEGYEGVMVRSPDGLYKQGRSTLKQGWLLKVKRFEDTEGVVVGYEELMHNANEEKKNALGYTERSTSKAGKKPMDMLGALWVKSDKWDEEFHIGTGFTEQMRKEFWKDKGSLKGRLVKFKYQPSGELNKPRFPVFLGFRPVEDTDG